MNDLRGAIWRKSTHCESGQNGSRNQCVEVAFLDTGYVAVRDTKENTKGPVLRFTPEEWNAFIAGAKDGEFDQP